MNIKGLAAKLGLMQEHLEEERPNLHNELGYLKILQTENMYAGTVPPQIVAQRRKKNKEARRARRINRSH